MIFYYKSVHTLNTNAFLLLYQTVFGATPMLAAIRAGLETVVEALLANGVSVNIKISDGVRQQEHGVVITCNCMYVYLIMCSLIW